MATGQPGFGDSLFKLATQRQTALRNEQIRKRNEDTLRRNDINTLSGFDAASIEGDQQRAIFEDAVADVQSYITGTGEYEDATYDPVNFQKQINKIRSLYNGFTAHNAGDVATAREKAENDSYTAGGTDLGRVSGKRIRTNNTPSSYDQAVSDHNNYFETAKTPDGKVMFDENGHPMGYPVIDGEVDRTAAPVSLFKMNAYANPENFRGNTIEIPIESIVDVAQNTDNISRLNTIHNTMIKDTPGMNPETRQRNSITALFNDWWERDGDKAVDFREAMLNEVMNIEGALPPTFSEQDQEAFIKGEPLSPEGKKTIDQVRRIAESKYYDNSFGSSETQETSSNTSGSFESEGGLFSSQTSIPTQSAYIGDDGELVASEEQDSQILMKNLPKEIKVAGDEEGDFSIVGLAVSGQDTLNAGVMYARIKVETGPEDTDISEESSETYTTIQIGPDAPTQKGKDIYATMGLQENKPYQSWLDGQSVSAAPDDILNWNKAKTKREERLQLEEKIVTKTIDPIIQASQNFVIFENPIVEERYIKPLSDLSPYEGPEEEFEGMRTSEVAKIRLKEFLENTLKGLQGTGDVPTFERGSGSYQTYSVPEVDITPSEIKNLIDVIDNTPKEEDLIPEEPKVQETETPQTRQGVYSREQLEEGLQDWEKELRSGKGGKPKSGVAVLAKNFGNLRPNNANPYKSGVYEVSEGNQYQSFKTYEQGLKGLVWDIKSKQHLGGLSSGQVSKDATLQEGINKYAPAEDKNNPESYANFVVDFVNKETGSDYSVNDQFSDFPTELLIEAIIAKEDISLYNKLNEEGYFDKKLAEYSTKITSTQKA